MRVLLIGKYPPVQGGVASKAYWLSQALAPLGVSFHVVTHDTPGYRAPLDSQIAPSVSTRVIASPEAPPWFIPGGDLSTERLLAEVFQAAESARPDLIEANYLVPYGLAAWMVARELGLPLLLRHAGSDVAKLLRWGPVRHSLCRLLGAASLIATAADTREEIVAAGASPGRTVAVSRYAPDPNAFCPGPAETRSAPTLLVAGKLNWHWRWKGFDALFSAVSQSPEWKVHLVGDGNGREAVLREIESCGLTSRVQVQDFVTPTEMPTLIRQASVVWAVHSASDIGDPSNLVWEAASIGRKCLLARHQLAHPDITSLKRMGADLAEVDPDQPASVTAALIKAAEYPASPGADLSSEYHAYVQAQHELYLRAVGA